MDFPVMKKAGFLIMTYLFLGHLSASSQTLNFSGKEIPISDLLRIIKCQTGVSFFYDVDLLKDAKPVSVNWKNLQLEKALTELFKDCPLTWVLENKTVTIIRKKTVKKQTDSLFANN